MRTYPLILTWLFVAILLSPVVPVHAAIQPVGSGSYTTTFPGTDSAGRNGFPGGSPQLSGSAVGRPVPTNDWWSALLNTDHAGNLFNYPLAMGTLPTGLDIGYLVPTSGPNGSSVPRDPFNTIVVGVTGLSATRATVDNYSDWTVTMAWNSGGHTFRATSGIGMPFVYFSKGTTDTASVTVSEGTATIDDEILLITGSQGGANFAVYAPVGAAWIQSGDTYTSTLAGENYWSMAMLPAGTPSTVAAAWQQYAYVEPTDTTVSWDYDEATAILRTEFTTTVMIHEGSGTTVMQGLLPHQWAHLAPDAPSLTGESLSSIRGELKLMAANTFATERAFQGILPTLPALGALSEGFDPAALSGKVQLMENESLSTWTDSYNDGQVLNRLIQTARIAHETGDLVARDKMVATIKERIEDWLSAEAGEVAFLFYYQPNWTALLGYPSGHGQDTNLNDHHFHWGYFIHAAAFMEQFEPGWADQWGDMVNLLIRDAASPDRSDPLFPFLRSFSPFAGHAWANGFATFPFGNDQESSSESMQFNSSLIHWGAITGDTAIRDLGIFLYTTEQSAIEEYWFDINERTFKPEYGFALASRIWGNGYDNQTFWTNEIAAAYGIELYPIHGGSLYLGQNLAYATDLWTEMTQNTGVLNQVANDNLWHDVYWQFLAFTDPAAAIDLYNAYPDRALKFGISEPQTYYWLHAMNALGQVDASVTADDPLAAVFSKSGNRTYVAHNYGETEKTITFSDGATLRVPPGTLATSRDLSFSGDISTPFPTAPAGNTVPLTVTLEGDSSSLTAVEFFDGLTSIGTLVNPPYVLQTGILNSGKHTFYARLYQGDTFTLTGQVTVNVGDSFPFSGTPTSLPGMLEAGNYDTHEGGIGQDITYHDSSVGNNGDYRPNEYVDASTGFGEGAVVGWIADGEWIEYTVDVAESGLYRMDFRYASDNNAGGGPFYLELDGRIASPEKTVPSTNDWAAYTTATLNNIELRAGLRILRIHFIRGEFNLGRMTFTRTGPLPYQPPVADAGMHGSILQPETTAFLDGSLSLNPAGGELTYRWEQVSGPAEAQIQSPLTATTNVSGLITDGIYRFLLTVDNGSHEDMDIVELVRGDIALRPPTVAILNPSDGARGLAGDPLDIQIAASDPDGEIVQLDLFNGDRFLGSINEEPYGFTWYPPEGSHELVAVAVDSDGLSTTSTSVSFTASPPLPCRQASASGDFEYEFSGGADDPAITFIPSRSGVGAGIILLYYGTGGGPYPGYILQPNTPYPLNAGAGQTINFYFTYSVPEGGERNTIAENTSYTIGSCGDPIETDPELAKADWLAAHFDPADLNNAALESTLWGDFADPDLDGLVNLFEFTTGGDPHAFTRNPVTCRPDPVTGEWRFHYGRRAGLPAAYGWLQWSTNLTDWHSDGVSPAAISLRDGIEQMEARIEYVEQNPEAPIYVRLVTGP